MSRNASKPKNIKENNVRLILTILYEKKEMTAQALSAVTGISKTTINKLISDLVSAGIVLSEGKGCSTSEGGRKPEIYRFNEKYKYIISAELYEDSTYCSILDLNCQIIYNYMEEFQECLAFDVTVEKLRENIKLGLEKTELKAEQIGAVVISCSAIVNEEKGIIERTTIGSWQDDLPVADSISDMFLAETPIIVNNIARFSGYAELQRMPELKHERVATILFWDETVGGTMIDKGKFDNGANNMMGEIGHIVLEHNWNININVDDSGQFENLVNKKAVLKYAVDNGLKHKQSILYQAVKDGNLTIDTILDGYNRNDEYAVEILNRSALCIALIMHYISVIYDPKYFILQGFYYQAGDKFLELLHRMVTKLVPFCNMNSFIVMHSLFGEEYKSAFNIGAGLYAVELLIRNTFFLYK